MHDLLNFKLGSFSKHEREPKRKAEVEDQMVYLLSRNPTVPAWKSIPGPSCGPCCTLQQEAAIFQDWLQDLHLVQSVHNLTLSSVENHPFSTQFSLSCLLPNHQSRRCFSHHEEGFGKGEEYHLHLSLVVQIHCKTTQDIQIRHGVCGHDAGGPPSSPCRDGSNLGSSGFRLQGINEYQETKSFSDEDARFVNQRLWLVDWWANSVPPPPYLIDQDGSV